ncbi:ABC transporter substrate-binding protein [Desulforamulus hydrothermalis]|uniref:Extracellular ligand-binding receptor n=1 Tax=Desulforamulus hydrothermalis Lam5 = DSM 18033 TaxID=1121428 RepID=K8DYX0_9FIRM|nr:ABC transporter substrate-binding protein [Desulforamulus hydrothermalis]CCO08119.1 Extracellular ligand-binding receptor [Desulforamulus hydrothermalis Lam5 = DSM 18033]SHG81572.1 amino acid/amide ABC transporter substrate-binding protein, HAAT family [Desulforamulus hydrothermalis Lam5 = DSM 18033]
MYKRKYVAIIALLLAAVMVLAGCGGGGAEKQAAQQPAADVIKIGVFEPLTGTNAAGGEMTVEGIKLANQLFPEVNGKKVELVIVDNKSEKQEAANAVERLVSKDKVNVIIGSYSSSLSMAGGPIAKEAGIPVIGCSPTNPAVTLGNDYYFRVCFIDPFQGTVMANYAVEKLGAKTAAIIQDVQQDYSVGLSNYFEKSFKKLTNNDNAIVAKVNYNSGDKDFSSQLTTVKAKNPDVIFAPGNFLECGILVEKARELGINAPILGGDTWEAEEFLSRVKNTKDIYFSTHFDADHPVTEMSNKFMEEYKKAYPGKQVNAFGALGFDTYILALDAIKRAGSADPKAIRDALAATKDFQGATGIITLDANGDATKTAIIKKVVDGKFAYEGKVDPK